MHNLDIDECKLALKEIERSQKNNLLQLMHIQIKEEKKMMYEWNLTAKTILHTDEWKKVFQDNNYSGDYYWFNHEKKIIFIKEIYRLQKTIRLTENKNSKKL